MTKYIITLFIVCLSGNIAFAQNMILNPSFEESNNNEVPYPDAENDIDDLQDWDDDDCMDVTYKGIDPGSTSTEIVNLPIGTHSPDWISMNVNFIEYAIQGFVEARTGSKFIGMAPYELIKQEIGNNDSFDPNKTLKLKLYFKKVNRFFGRSADWSKVENISLNVYASKKTIKYKGKCKESVVNDEYLIRKVDSCLNGLGDHRDQVGQNIIKIASFDINRDEFVAFEDEEFDDWYILEKTIPPIGSDFNWVTVEHTNGFYLDDERCGGFIVLEDISLEDACKCNDIELLENTTYEVYDFELQANEKVIVGSNVGADSRDKEVVVGASSNVMYHTGEEVVLKPGFSTVLGSEFNAYIEACEFEEGKITYQIPDKFTPNGDGIDDEWCILVDNVMSYELRIYNRWGDMILNTVGEPINNEICVEGSFAIASDQYKYALWLFNCKERESTLGDVVVLRKNENIIDSSNEHLKIFPNPTSDILNILFTAGTQLILENEYVIYNNFGQMVLRDFMESKEYSTSEVDVSNLSNGVYILEVRDSSGSIYRSKFIVSR